MTIYVHYYDQNQAQRCNQFERIITKGKAKGSIVVRDWQGKKVIIPPKFEAKNHSFNTFIGLSDRSGTIIS
jgi:hypothetical protein